MKAGIKNVCVHKGLFPPSVEKQFPQPARLCDVSDVGKAAKDWPQLNFVDLPLRLPPRRRRRRRWRWRDFERTGRIAWVSDLADIPRKYGVNNVYGDLGQLFATTLVAQPVSAPRSWAS